MKIQDGGDLLICPHCNKEQSDAVKDYVIPGSFLWNDDECEICFGKFSVRSIDKDGEEFQISYWWRS